MAKIEVSIIDNERNTVINEINALGYGFDYEYVSYSNNTIVIPNMTPDDKDKFICFLNEHEIFWGN